MDSPGPPFRLGAAPGTVHPPRLGKQRGTLRGPIPPTRAEHPPGVRHWARQAPRPRFLPSHLHPGARSGDSRRSRATCGGLAARDGDGPGAHATEGGVLLRPRPPAWPATLLIGLLSCWTVLRSKPSASQTPWPRAPPLPSSLPRLIGDAPQKRGLHSWPRLSRPGLCRAPAFPIAPRSENLAVFAPTCLSPDPCFLGHVLPLAPDSSVTPLLSSRLLAAPGPCPGPRNLERALGVGQDLPCTRQAHTLSSSSQQLHDTGGTVISQLNRRHRDTERRCDWPTVTQLARDSLGLEPQQDGTRAEPSVQHRTAGL